MMLFLKLGLLLFIFLGIICLLGAAVDRVADTISRRYYND